LRIILMVDNEQHISLLEQFDAEKPWDIFVKINVGSQRAGVPMGSSALQSLVKRAETSTHVRIYGFYCHAGHSYAGKNSEQAQETLGLEVSSVLNAAALLPADRELILSIGSTPTAHVVSSLKTQLPDNVKLELHAGEPAR
jgi:D-serine ammonia-lyase